MGGPRGRPPGICAVRARDRPAAVSPKPINFFGVPCARAAGSSWHCFRHWRPFLRSIYEREAGDLKAVPAVHHLYTNLALGMAPLPEGDLIQTQAIFRSAIWTFENPHYLAMRSFLHKGQLNSAQRSWRLVHEMRATFGTMMDQDRVSLEVGSDDIVGALGPRK
jgi:hypothetical protein